MNTVVYKESVFLHAPTMHWIMILFNCWDSFCNIRNICMEPE